MAASAQKTTVPAALRRPHRATNRGAGRGVVRGERGTHRYRDVVSSGGVMNEVSGAKIAIILSAGCPRRLGSRIIQKFLTGARSTSDPSGMKGGRRIQGW